MMDKLVIDGPPRLGASKRHGSTLNITASLAIKSTSAALVALIVLDSEEPEIVNPHSLALLTNKDCVAHSLDSVSQRTLSAKTLRGCPSPSTAAVSVSFLFKISPPF